MFNYDTWGSSWGQSWDASWGVPDLVEEEQPSLGGGSVFFTSTDERIQIYDWLAQAKREDEELMEVLPRLLEDVLCPVV